MSAETDLRAVLVAHAPLTAACPAWRISIDAVPQGLPRPFIVFSSQGGTPTFGLNNSLLGVVTAIDIQCVANTRATAITLRELVQAALAAAGWPWVRVSAGMDADNGLEVEVVSVNWME